MPNKNQLFKIIPDSQIIQSILEAFGLDNLEDTRLFTKSHMKDIETADQLIKLNDKLKDYYLPCKAKKYLINSNDINPEKKCITLLRQFIKIYNYKCIGMEKSIDGKKNMTYRLLYSKGDFLSSPIPNGNKIYTLSFENYLNSFF